MLLKTTYKESKKEKIMALAKVTSVEIAPETSIDIQVQQGKSHLVANLHISIIGDVIHIDVDKEEHIVIETILF